MPPSASPPPDAQPDGARSPSALVFSAWNLLLLVPLLMLVTPWFNKDRPRLAGLPFFYWYQFAFVVVGVVCVWVVFMMTRKHSAVTDLPDRQDHLGVDDLNEGGRA
jgi:MFS superfamily sulfate permease-like transporter